MYEGNWVLQVDAKGDAGFVSSALVADGASVGALASAVMAWCSCGFYLRLMAAAAPVYATVLRSICQV